MLKENVVKELNIQINREFQSSYLYLSMSMYCDSINMEGFANWMRIQSEEEKFHGMKIYNFLSDMGANAGLLPLDKPRSDFASLEDMMEEVLKAEQDISEHLNSIAKLALKEGDMITFNFMDWFLNEQVEEVSSTSLVLEKVKLIGGNGNGLYLLDQEMAKRKEEAEEA